MATTITDPRELTVALQAAARPQLQPSILEHMAERLASIEHELVTRMAAETGFARADCASLVAATQRFLRHLPELAQLHDELYALETRLYRRFADAVTIELRPWGSCIICTPANAPAPLALALPLAFVAAGNRVAVASSGRSRGAALTLAALVADAFPQSVFLWDGSVRAAIDAAVAADAVDLVYFLGASAHFSGLAAKCAAAGVELIYEGEGNSLALLDGVDAADWPSVIDALLLSKTAFNGQMCSAPNAIVVPAPQAAAFAAAYAGRAARLRLDLPLGQLAGPATCDHIESCVQAGATVHGSSGPIAAARVPLLISGVSMAQAMRRELFCPAVFLIGYDDRGEIRQMLGRIRHRLQVTVFSRDPDTVGALIDETRFARYVVNRCPIEQDPVLPWGNYGVSGRADVLDFYRKGLRRVIVERGSV